MRYRKEFIIDNCKYKMNSVEFVDFVISLLNSIDNVNYDNVDRTIQFQGDNIEDEPYVETEELLEFREFVNGTRVLFDNIEDNDEGYHTYLPVSGVMLMVS